MPTYLTELMSKRKGNCNGINYITRLYNYLNLNLKLSFDFNLQVILLLVLTPNNTIIIE